MKAEHEVAEESEFGRRLALGEGAEELQVASPLKPQEHLDQELNSTRAAEREAEQLLRVLEEVLVLEGFGFWVPIERLQTVVQLGL
jgi:hypothetical protein